MQALRTLVVSLALAGSADLAFCWEPPKTNVDPDVIVNEAFADAVDGKLADAAQKHVWYHENAIRLKPIAVQVRLTFVLEEWLKLARRYPPAMQDLLGARDRAAQRVLAMGPTITDDFTEVVRINEALGDAEATRSLYAQLGQKDETQAARFWLFALPALAAKQDFALAARYLQVNQVLQTLDAQLAQLRNAQGLPPDARETLQTQANRHIDLTVARVIWVLNNSNRADVAPDVARRGREMLKTGTPTPLIDAALGGGPLAPKAS